MLFFVNQGRLLLMNLISGIRNKKKFHLQDLMSWGRNFRGATPASLICRHINLFKYGIAGNAYTLAL